MATIYGLDLRQRVVHLRKNKNMSVKKISKLLLISPESIYDWLKREKTTGNLAPKTGYQKGHSHKIKDIEAFKKFVNSNSHDTAKILAEKLGNVSKSTVAKVLKDIGYSKKKDFWLQRTEAKRSRKV
jgi:transposase